MHSIIRMAALLAMLHVTPVYASDIIASYISDSKPVGSGRLRVFMTDVYDATLFASQGKWNPGDPFALQLTYLREIKGHAIADRSVQEMRNIGFNDEIKLAAWHTQMRSIFPDVDEGVSITGILTSKGESIFLRNGQKIGIIKDLEFGKVFFAIWLSEKTGAPQLRQKLLGLS